MKKIIFIIIIFFISFQTQAQETYKSMSIDKVLQETYILHANFFILKTDTALIINKEVYNIEQGVFFKKGDDYYSFSQNLNFLEIKKLDGTETIIYYKD